MFPRRPLWGGGNTIPGGPAEYTPGMVDALTAVAAVLGALGSLVAGVGVLILNGKVDRLSGRVDRLAGRVDAIEATLQTLMSALIGRGWRTDDFGGRAAAAPLDPAK